MKIKRGFTLVELLVVIAIVALLASVVLQRIDATRIKGAEAKIVAELEGFHKNGMGEELEAGNFNVVCGQNGYATATALTGLVTSLTTNTNEFRCWSTADEFAASAELETGRHWCVDSVGGKKEIPASLVIGTTACP